MKLSAITATSAQVKAVVPGKSLDRRQCLIGMAAAVPRALMELAVQAP